jgi:hypothetical protein
MTDVAGGSLKHEDLRVAGAFRNGRSFGYLEYFSAPPFHPPCAQLYDSLIASGNTKMYCRLLRHAT